MLRIGLYVFDSFYFAPACSFILQNKGDERPSFAGTLIREHEHHRLSTQEAAWTTASM